VRGLERQAMTMEKNDTALRMPRSERARLRRGEEGLSKQKTVQHNHRQHFCAGVIGPRVSPSPEEAPRSS
jgi:hypothetical protein